MKNQPNKSNEDNLQLLGTIIREIRLQLNITQSDVSAATGLHINTISNIERGQSFRIDNLIIISCYYELKPSDILSVVGL